MAARKRTFPQFRRLPPELRDLIWEMALRTDVPGVHFFTTFDRHPGRDLVTTLHLPGSLKAGFLGAPRCDEHDPEFCSWTARNPSTYLFDGNLWKACRESRAVIQRHYRHFEGRGTSRTARVANFSVNGERRSFKLFTDLDLFCLQPFSPEESPWKIFPPRSPLFRRGVKHIALEFEPQWASGCLEWGYNDWLRNPIGATIMSCSGRIRNIWFIDYTITRRHGNLASTGHRGNRLTFEGIGCNYVEVREKDPDWNKRKHLAFNFVDVHGKFLDWHYGEYPRNQRPQCPQLRVLAREYTP
ncbi:hypothetical protein F4780DRAFT_774322 [Xylariomycetidae sp. FL0641]|nr:hypothetical protein F4780DRAFT_774322 [Xylariomycetidae sp. FL0641]